MLHRHGREVGRFIPVASALSEMIVSDRLMREIRLLDDECVAIADWSDHSAGSQSAQAVQHGSPLEACPSGNAQQLGFIVNADIANMAEKAGHDRLLFLLVIRHPPLPPNALLPNEYSHRHALALAEARITDI
jgi:hypothetical protein